MDNDDKPVGLLLSRRDALKLLGIGGATLLASCASPTGTAIPVTGATLSLPDRRGS